MDTTHALVLEARYAIAVGQEQIVNMVSIFHKYLLSGYNYHLSVEVNETFTMRGVGSERTGSPPKSGCILSSYPQYLDSTCLYRRISGIMLQYSEIWLVGT